jgi:hypothetical protein
MLIAHEDASKVGAVEVSEVERKQASKPRRRARALAARVPAALLT